MNELSKSELLDIEGGASATLSGSLLTAYLKGADVSYGLGKKFGSSMRKIFLVGVFALI